MRPEKGLLSFASVVEEERLSTRTPSEPQCVRGQWSCEQNTISDQRILGSFLRGLYSGRLINQGTNSV